MGRYATKWITRSINTIVIHHMLQVQRLVSPGESKIRKGIQHKLLVVQVKSLIYGSGLHLDCN